jgi:hypothetical protein
VPAGRSRILLCRWTATATRPTVRALGKARITDLIPGDEFTRRPTRKRYRLANVSAYREHPLSDEEVVSGRIPADGYPFSPPQHDFSHHWSDGPHLGSAEALADVGNRIVFAWVRCTDEA